MSDAKVRAIPRNIPLPCPFCGKEPATAPVNPKIEGDAWGSVRCINRRCPTYDEGYERGVIVMDGARTNDGRGSKAYIQAAIARWNRRS